MSDSPQSHGGPGGPVPDGGAGETLRAAIERTMQATAGSAASTRGRAAELVDELARRGREAGAELARRGQDATGEVARRLELLERRLGELERALGDAGPAAPARAAPDRSEPRARPEAEG